MFDAPFPLHKWTIQGGTHIPPYTAKIISWPLDEILLKPGVNSCVVLLPTSFFVAFDFRVVCVLFRPRVSYNALLGSLVLARGSWQQSLQLLEEMTHAEPGPKKLLISSNYSDLTRPISPQMVLNSNGNPLISGKSRLVKYYSNLASFMDV